jgi:hydroxymethylpyrimidine/phosphomethylpyrimidine kinase
MQKGRVLVIAGSDCSGGAGIQADIKTITALGAYAATAITALTAQNTTGVFGTIEVPAEFVEQQIKLVLDDIGADCIKTGMLHNAKIIETVAQSISLYGNMPLILDPVMVSTSGQALLNGKSALAALKEVLIPKATLVTANIPEAEILSGIRVDDKSSMIAAGEKIIALGARNVLVKGGHMDDDVVQDILILGDGTVSQIYEHTRIYTKNTHGTGCTLASAIACGLARGKSLKRSITEGRRYVYDAIRTARGFGKGKGPLNHCCWIKDFM